MGADDHGVAVDHALDGGGDGELRARGGGLGTGRPGQQQEGEGQEGDWQSAQRGLPSPGASALPSRGCIGMVARSPEASYRPSRGPLWGEKASTDLAPM